MIAWMLYALTISAALALGAWCAERVLRLLHLPTRWPWAMAIAGSVTLPLLALRPRAMSPLDVSVGPVTGGVLAPAPLAGAGDVAAAASSDWTLWIAAAWVAVSATLLLLAAVGAVRLARVRRRWRQTKIDGVSVRVSRAVGPAVTGVFRPEIVVPAWALELPEAERSLLLRHEREHITARDPLLCRAAFLVLAAVPWNLPLWWTVRRLWTAVEIDCDGRVVRQTDERARYGHLLINVGARRSAHPWAALALSPRLPSLEQRIRAMTMTPPKHRALRAGGFAAVIALSLVLVAAADPPVVNVATPAPVADEPPLPEHAPVVAEAPADTNDVRAEPRFTPYEVAPEVRDREAFQRALIEAYPRDLQEAGVQRTILWIFVDEVGRVGEIRVAESSGRESLDEAAVRAAGEVEFSPARHRDEPVAVWVQFPVVFQAPEREEQEVQRTSLQPETPARPLDETRGEEAADSDAAQPTFTPFEQAPRIRDREAFDRAMREAYPEALREAGVGGTAVLWVRIDEEGRVADTRVERSSGHDALDEAAVRVLRGTEFSPAVNRSEPVGVWVQFPVTFGTG